MNDRTKTATNEELTEWYKNAYTTWGGCMGRGKAYRNEGLMNVYKKELKERGLEIPEGQGIFNGEGSS